MALTPQAMIDRAADAADRMRKALHDATTGANALADAVEDATKRLHLPNLAAALAAYRAEQACWPILATAAANGNTDSAAKS
jgi:hypothetical protein